MKVSLNWVKEYTDVDLPVDELVMKIGAQLGAVEDVIDLGKKYQGIMVARVVKCEKHPNADKLSLCLIDDGGTVQGVERDENGHVQVVCGAPNVREGLLVAWLPPGATVPSSYNKEPFVLEARELRGKVSNGMLASAHELALSDDHSGIMELDPEITVVKTGEGEVPHSEALSAHESVPKVKPGDDFAEAYGLNDYIIDIENKMFTHRPDCFGILGVAREIAGITQRQFTSPRIYMEPKTTGTTGQDSLLLEVVNELPDLVPRFLAQVFGGTTVKPSPVWMQVQLAKVGIRPINNIVDITNYYMYLTGQPLHAYDYDKLKALDESDHATIVVRYPRQGEKITLLSGKEITPRKEAIMIASGTRLIGVGGVMGGADTEVDENTKNIVLECATFDMYSIRRTAMEHGLFTDAVTRFNKGQSPLQNDRVLAWAAGELVCNAGAVPAATIHDLEGALELPRPITLSNDFINERLGLALTAEQMAELLRNVEFVVAVEGDDLTVTTPFWRTDIEIPEDVVEEVGRLYGYDHLPLELPKRDLTPVVPDALLRLKARVRAELSRAGANEVLTYSFVHGNLIDKVGQDKAKAFQLSNAISPDLQYYRMSLTPSLLDKVHANAKAGYDEFALFELGKVHSKTEIDEDGLPREFNRIALVYAASDKKSRQLQGAPYYQAKKYAEQLLGTTHFSSVPYNDDLLAGHELSLQMAAPFEPSRSALLHDGDRYVGITGEFRSGVRKALKLPKYCAGFEIFLTAIPEVGPAYTPLPRFPKVEQDISLRVPAEVQYDALYGVLKSALTSITQGQPEEQIHFQLQPLDIHQRQVDPGHKQIAFRLTIASYQRTMKAEEVNAMLDAAATAASSEFGASRL